MTQTTSKPIFYEIGGPHAHRREWVLSIFTIIILAAVLAWVIYRLNKAGQFSSRLWAPILAPSDDQFGPFWRFMLAGAKNTIYTLAGAVVGSYLVGVVLAIAVVWSRKVVRWFLIGWIEIFRGTSTIILIFTVATVLYQYGLRFPAVWYMIIAITLHASAAIAEVFRAGLNALPRHQVEASHALGLSNVQTYVGILLPQATRIMAPALISQLVLIVMDTSLGFVINFDDLLGNAGIAIQNLKNPIQVYALIAAIYLCLNYLLSKGTRALIERATVKKAGVIRPTSA